MPRNTAAIKIVVEATSLLWQLQWHYNTDNKMYLNLYNSGGHFSGKSLLMATKFNLGVNAPEKSHQAAFIYTNFRCKLARFFSFGHSRFSYLIFFFVYLLFFSFSYPHTPSAGSRCVFTDAPHCAKKWDAVIKVASEFLHLPPNNSVFTQIALSLIKITLFFFLFVVQY